MARVNLERRAEIGRERRARTRATILDAARSCYAQPGVQPVTIEMLTQAAGVAKGTFYVHFPDLATLEAELGDEILGALAERHQAALGLVADPLTRIATVVTILLLDLAQRPVQARLVARAIAVLPDFALAVQDRLRNDIVQVRDAGVLQIGSPCLAAHVVVAIVAQAAQLIGAGELEATGIGDLVRAILRSLGCAPQDAARRVETALGHAEAIIRTRLD